MIVWLLHVLQINQWLNHGYHFIKNILEIHCKYHNLLLRKKSNFFFYLSFHRNLLSLLHTNETSISGLSSSKELGTIVQQLRTISNEEDDNNEHDEFLRVYAKNVINVLIEFIWNVCILFRILLLLINVKHIRNLEVALFLNYLFYWWSRLLFIIIGYG